MEAIVFTHYGSPDVLQYEGSLIIFAGLIKSGIVRNPTNFSRRVWKPGLREPSGMETRPM